MVRPLRAASRLRTQEINEAATDPRAWGAIRDADDSVVQKIFYSPKSMLKRSVPAAISSCLGVPEGVMDLPPLPHHGLDLPRPYAVVRPVTVRSEWRNEARNPDPRYVADVARELIRAGYYVVSLAHVDPPHEWLIEPRPPADLFKIRGELDTLRALSLVAGADVVAGGVGWIVPAAYAAGVPLIGILGGQGGHNAPEQVTPKPHADHEALWLYPDNYCRCADMRHDCKKEITDAGGKCRAWLERLAAVRVGA
jgi:hypothetical protein